MAAAAVQRVHTAAMVACVSELGHGRLRVVPVGRALAGLGQRLARG